MLGRSSCGSPGPSEPAADWRLHDGIGGQTLAGARPLVIIDSAARVLSCLDEDRVGTRPAPLQWIQLADRLPSAKLRRNVWPVA